jgi:enterochelin esterase-like enzyme
VSAGERTDDTGPIPSARLSDPRFAPEHLRFLGFESAALRARGDVTLFVPDGPGRDRPLVVLLHGAYGAHWSWAFRGGAHLVAAQLMRDGEIPPMVLAMPSDGMRGATSGYLPQPEADYEAWIMRDLLEALRALVPGVGARSPLFLAGYSMGGFGALRLGAKYAGQVRGVSAHAAVTHLDQLPPFLYPGSIAPVVQDREEADALTWWRRHRARVPPLRFDCGRADTLLPANRGLHAALAAEHIAHDFSEHDGGHDFDYYRARLPETLRFFAGLSGGRG